MISELYGLLFPQMPIDGMKGALFLGALFFSGLAPSFIFKPSVGRFLLGMLVISLAYVVDVIVSGVIVFSQQLEIDRFPANVELFMYGIITIGWLIGCAISDLVHRQRRHPKSV